jgi:hypothetical protein
VTDNAKRSVLERLLPTVRTCVDAAAYAWINAGGVSSTVEDYWTDIQKRVEELESEETQ